MQPSENIQTIKNIDRPLHVAMLIWSYWPGHEGGAERQCRKIIPHLLRRGVDVTVLTARTSRKHLAQEPVDGYQIIRLGFGVAIISHLVGVINGMIARLPVGLKGSARLNAKRREFIAFWFCLPFHFLERASFLFALHCWFKRTQARPSIIHVHETLWLCGAAAAFAGSYGIPVIAKTAISPAIKPIGYDVPLRKYFSSKRKYCHFLALNSVLRLELLGSGIADEQVFVIPNAVEVQSIDKRKRESLDVLLVANFSQGVEDKAFDVLIKAWKIVIAAVPSSRLMLVGGGTSLQWRRMVESMRLESAIHFVGWADNPSAFYKDAAVFVLPSRSEGMSNALLEAQSYGVPCVVSDIPGNLAVVEDGVNGLVVPVGDEQALAKALICLLLDPSLRESLGSKAHNIAASRFSLESVAERLVETYRLIAESRCDNG